MVGTEDNLVSLTVIFDNLLLSAVYKIQKFCRTRTRKSAFLESSHGVQDKERGEEDCEKTRETEKE